MSATKKISPVRLQTLRRQCYQTVEMPAVRRERLVRQMEILSTVIHDDDVSVDIAWERVMS